MKWLAWLPALACVAGAVTLERTDSTGGGPLRLRVWYVPDREPIAALRLSVRLEGAADAPLKLYPGTHPAWTQVPPQLKRTGTGAEVLALAPGQLRLGGSEPIALFELQVDSSAKPAAFASIRVLEALDAQSRPLSLSLRDSFPEKFVDPAYAYHAKVDWKSDRRVHEMSFYAGNLTRVRGRILDAAGHPVVALADSALPDGLRRIRWNGMGPGGASLPAGDYFLELRLGMDTYLKKVRHVP